MGCVLRAGGADFDVDGFLRESSFAPCVVFRRGEPRLASSQSDGPVHQQSGFNLDVTEADFDQLPQQTNGALRFLRIYQAELERLVNHAGVEGVEIDFAVNRSEEKFVESYVFAPELLTLIGALGIKLSLSCYTA